MSKEKRAKERIAWSELKIVINNYRALGFDYLIRRRLSQQNVCFGSTIEREACTLENSKMNSVMRRIAASSGPPINALNSSLRKVVSVKAERKSNSVFKSTVPRFIYKTSNEKIFNPNDALRPTKINSVQYHKSHSKMLVDFVTPCPGTYNIDYKRKYKYHDSFGGKKLPIPATKSLCIPNPTITCDKCGMKVKGDFWQEVTPLSTSTYCKCCMKNEKNRAKYSIKKKNLKFNRLAELDTFDRTQDCTFYHRHGGTTASVKLLPKREMIQKSRWEHYLSQFSL